MSDKEFEKDNINGENGVSSNPAPADSESSNKADYEEESSWKFEKFITGGFGRKDI